MKIPQKLKEGVKTHFVDSTAMNVICNPLFAGLETMVLGMSDEISFNARLLGTGLTYAGIGFLISKGRNLYRKVAKVNDNAKESIQQLHDAVYMGLFCLAFDPAFYYVAGARSAKEIIGGTAIGVAFGLTTGGAMGYTIDAFRDLTGIKESPRLPLSIKNKSPKFKLALAAAITAASIALNAGIYELTSDKKQESVKNQNIEKIVNYNSTQ